MSKAKSKLRAKKVTSMNSLKQSLKKGSGSEYLSRVPEGEVVVRFLTEPTEWIDYSEHYDAVNKFFPCVIGECPACLEGNRPSGRYLANALNRDEDKVIPLVIPKTLAGTLQRKYDRYKTLLDRDYILEREGQGMDTTYDATPETPTKLNVSKYDLLDLWTLLEAQLVDSRDDDDDDVDDEDDIEEVEEVAPKKKARKAAAPVEDEDEEDDDIEDDEDDDDGLDRDRLEALGIRELKAKAIEAGASSGDVKGKSKAELVDIILDEDDVTTVVVDEDDDDDDEITEEDLEAMSLAELKTLCKENGVVVPRGADKDTLIDLLLDEDDDE